MLDRFLRKDRLKHLGERECLEFEETYSRFYQSEGLDRECVRFILLKLSEALELPLGVLRPTDRFAVELAPLKNTWGVIDDTDFSLIVMTDLLRKNQGITIDLRKVPTIGEFVRAACVGRKGECFSS
jgi:hypothetical protein